MAQWALGAGLALMIALIAFKAKLLTVDGAVAAFLVGAGIFGAGGWKASIPLLVFFATSNLLGRFHVERKAKLQDGFGKEKRDWKQVFANGGIAALCCVGAYQTRNPALLGAFFGALAAANADTWATEIGTALGKKPFNIVTGEAIEDGASGGVTFQGWAGALAGGLAVGVTTLLFSFAPAVFWFALIGWAGSLIDSLIGASFQAKYYCAQCGKPTEKRLHSCGQQTLRVSGFRLMTNDAVNLLCTLSGALLGLLVPIPLA